MTQNEMILEHMKTHKGITTMEAIEQYGITRLSGRIYELRQAGNVIANTDKTALNRFGKETRFVLYSLVRDSDGKYYTG